MEAENKLKPVAEMSDRELLMELVTEKRRQEKMRYVKYTVWGIVIIALIVLACIYVPKIAAAYEQVMEACAQIQEVSERADSVASQAEETMNNINDTLINKLNPAIDSYNSLRDAAAQKLQEASEAIGHITETLRNIFGSR